MRTHRPTPSHLFTVRLWPERVDRDRSEWRGRVHHVGTGRTRYFREWQALVAFIAEILGRPPSPGTRRRAGPDPHADPRTGG